MSAVLSCLGGNIRLYSSHILVAGFMLNELAWYKFGKLSSIMLNPIPWYVVRLGTPLSFIRWLPDWLFRSAIRIPELVE